MRFPLLLALLCGAAFTAAQAQQSQPAEPRFNWQKGPMTAKLGDQATIQIPEGFLFLDKPELPAFFEATKNFANGQELGIIAPASLDWFVIYEFDDVGFIKDDEKNALDADALFKSMSEAQEAGNEERKKRGWDPLTLYGWAEKPHYDSETHNLEWSLRLGSRGPDKAAINHKTRLLGRRGVMSVELIVGQDTYAATTPLYRNLNKTFAYTSDNKYSAWVKGDKVAEYGLGALVLGGAAAAAAKTGLFKGLWKMAIAFWKVIAIGVVAAFGFLKKLLFGEKEPAAQPAAEPEPPTTTT